MPQALIETYGEARLPRYTSYPTAPGFAATVGAGTYGDWLSGLSPETEASLYVHIPFCRSMCWYCGCHTTITRRDEPIPGYIDILRKEIGLVSAKVGDRLNIRHIHFGGGTPTIMQPEAFRDIVNLLRARFAFTTGVEIAVEIDPRTLTPEMALALGEAGVTRASLGVQSFDPAVQKAINRLQSETQTMEATVRLRGTGVSGINFDLIYGLPYQTVASCIETAKAAVRMRPDRFAVFGYAHIPSFKKHQRLIDESALPDAQMRARQAEAVAETLCAAGYVRIGLDHYALPADGLAVAARRGRLHRNFQGYTTDGCTTLIGFGASAIGRTPDGYVQNEVPPGLYAQRISSGRLATSRGYRLTAEDRMRAEIIERLMCDFHVDVATIAARHGFDPAGLFEGNTRLAALEQDGAIGIIGGTVTVRQGHRFIIRAVAAAFDAYIGRAACMHGKAA